MGFARAFSIASCIVGAFALFQPSVAKAPLFYSPRTRPPHEIADEYAGLRKRNKCLVRAVLKVESDNCRAHRSKAGASGCMQLMPATARALGLKVDSKTDERNNPEDNIPIGIKHLYELIDRHGLFLGLQIYNAGPKRVGKTKENREYPHKVFAELVKCQDTVNS